ncbi:MAG: porin family protein [Burkholderiales bacterium]
MKKHATLAAAFTLAAGFSPQLAAQVDWFTESVATPWYFGLGISRGAATPPQGTIDGVDAQFSAALGADNTIRDVDDRFNGARMFLGYELNRHLAVEAGVTRLGKTEVGYNFRSGITSVGGLIMNYRMSALYVDAVGKFPIDPKWSLLARIGASAGQTRVGFNGDPLTLLVPSEARDETEYNVKFGAGFEYNMTAVWTLRAEWDRWKMPDPLSSDDIEVDAFAASLLYRF